MITKMPEVRLKGVPASQGIAIGELIYIDMPEDPVPEFFIAQEAAQEEILRYHTAISQGKGEIVRLLTEFGDAEGAEGFAILETHLHMMEDPYIIAEVEKGI